MRLYGLVEFVKISLKNPANKTCFIPKSFFCRTFLKLLDKAM